MRKTPTLLAMLSCTLFAACQSIPDLPNARCSTLIPNSWSEGVPSADVPRGDLAEWQKGYVAQSTQLAKANGRTIDTINIVQNCEALVNEVRQPKRFLGIF